MTTNDKPITRNYDSDEGKSEIDCDIRVLKIRQRLAAHSGRRNSKNIELKKEKTGLHGLLT